MPMSRKLSLLANVKGKEEAESAVSEGQVALKIITRFMEAQLWGVARDELAKLQPRIDLAQESLTNITTSIKTHADQTHAAGILKEAEAKLKEAEDSVMKASEAEKPLLKENLPEEEAARAQAALESAASTAQNMASSVKTFLAMKKLNAKKLSESTAASTTEELTKMQTRFESSTKRLSEIRRSVNERKQSRLRKELEMKISESQQKLEAAGNALSGLFEMSSDVKAEAMKQACEGAQRKQKEADTIIQATKKALTERREKIPSTDVMAAELGMMMERLLELQTEIDRQKGSLKEHELKFVAQQLVRDAEDSTRNLERLLEATRETASSLISDSEEDNFRGSIFLGICTDALKAHMKKSAIPSTELFLVRPSLLPS